jgi:hypothetical protein
LVDAGDSGTDGEVTLPIEWAGDWQRDATIQVENNKAQVYTKRPSLTGADFT